MKKVAFTLNKCIIQSDDNKKRYSKKYSQCLDFKISVWLFCSSDYVGGVDKYVVWLRLFIGARFKGKKTASHSIKCDPKIDIHTVERVR